MTVRLPLVAHDRANLDWRTFYRVGTKVNSSVQLLPLGHTFFFSLCKRAKLWRSRQQLVLKKFCWSPFRGNKWFSRTFFKKLCWGATVHCWLLEVRKWLFSDDEMNVAPSFQWTYVSSCSTILSRAVAAAFSVRFVPGAKVRPSIWQRWWCCVGCDPHALTGKLEQTREMRTAEFVLWLLRGERRLPLPFLQSLYFVRTFGPLPFCQM